MRRAFTLLELLLVLAILVTIGAIAAPMLDRAFERQKLRGAAEQVRMAWEDAKLKALKTGQAQVFQCQLDTGTYTIQPLILHDDVNNVGSGATLITGGVAVQTSNTTFGLATDAADKSQFGSMQLDESVTFMTCQVATDSRTYSLAMSGSGGLTAASVGKIVVFYPDGTTSTAETLLRNQRGEVTGVQIRGLTGHSKILGLGSVEEMR